MTARRESPDPRPVAEQVYHHNVGGKTGCGAPLVRGNSMPELNHVTCQACIAAWHGGTLPAGWRQAPPSEPVP